MHILFRADGGQIRGSGHIVRCLTLADRLAREGHLITFISRADAGSLLDAFKFRNYRLLTLPAPPQPPVQTEEIWTAQEQQDDWASCSKLLNGQTFDWIIVDHYALDSAWEKLARQSTIHLAVIDDLANRSHNCNLLIDQNEYLGKELRYTHLLSAGNCILPGAAYALLRQEFSEARLKISAPRPQVKTALIMMGSADFQGQTLRLLKILRPMAKKYAFHVHLVIGQNNSQLKEIRSETADDPSFSIHSNHQRISELLLQTDLAFGAGGTATWEFCSLGIPLLLISFAQNQIALARDAAACGIADYLGHYNEISDTDISARVEGFIHSYELRQALHARSIGIVKADGADRVYKAILNLTTLRLRLATQEDSQNLLDWRNDDLTRSMSLNTKKISKENHDEWLAATLRHPHRLLLIAEAEGTIGVVRFDIADDTALVSLNLNPAYRGQGYAPLLLQKAEAFLPRDIVTLQAQIKPGNKASLTAFSKAGYSPLAEDSEMLTYLKKLPYNANSWAEGIHDPNH